MLLSPYITRFHAWNLGEIIIHTVAQSVLHEHKSSCQFSEAQTQSVCFVELIRNQFLNYKLGHAWDAHYNVLFFLLFLSFFSLAGGAGGINAPPGSGFPLSFYLLSCAFLFPLLFLFLPGRPSARVVSGYREATSAIEYSSAAASYDSCVGHDLAQQGHAIFLFFVLPVFYSCNNH